MTGTNEPGQTPPEPGAGAWLLAFVSLVLPWIGGALAIAGAFRMSEGAPGGLSLIAIAVALIGLDLAIDLWWAHPSVSVSAEPALNVRGAQLVGRLLVLEEDIVHGRGKVRAGDTVWACEGRDAPAGTRVRITGARGVLLKVEKD